MWFDRKGRVGGRLTRQSVSAAFQAPFLTMVSSMTPSMALRLVSDENSGGVGRSYVFEIAAMSDTIPCDAPGPSHEIRVSRGLEMLVPSRWTRLVDGFPDFG